MGQRFIAECDLVESRSTIAWIRVAGTASLRDMLAPAERPRPQNFVALRLAGLPARNQRVTIAHPFFSPASAGCHVAGRGFMGKADIIDGKARAAALSVEISQRTAELIEHTGVKPGLTVVIVGEDPASQVYVRNKKRTAEACGFNSVQHTLPADASQEEVMRCGGRSARTRRSASSTLNGD